ncbi:MAG TPA: hypothetical protein ENG06_04375 [Thermoplasmatales archaeon]|nr:hypothetical protein [Thermoplasmatales archaeon]
MRYAKVLLAIICMLSLIPLQAEAQPHTVWGYCYYDDATPAEGVLITAINEDTGETLANVTTTNEEGFYFFNTGHPTPGWDYESNITVVATATGDHRGWKGEVHLTKEYVPNQQADDIHLVPPAPETPAQPSGTTEGMVGMIYTYTTVATDPYEYNISYGWDWDGDGTVDEWDDNGGNYYPSGENITASHAWGDPGEYEIKVRAKNEWNVTGDWSPPLNVTIEADTVPPNTFIISGPSGTVTVSTVSFSWSGDDDITGAGNLVYSYKLEGYDTGWSSWTSSTTTVYENLPNGAYVFKVKAKDEAGNTDNIPATREFTVKKDVNPPDTRIIQAPPSETQQRGSLFIWTGNDDVTPVNKLQYSYTLEGFQSSWSNWSSETTVTFSSLPNGNYTFKVKAKDEAGNMDETPATHQFTVNVSSDDVTPPVVHIVSPSDVNVSGTVTLQWQVTDDDTNIVISIYYSSDNGTTWHTLVENESGISSYEWNTNDMKNGAYIVAVYATDSAGNVGFEKKTYTVDNRKTLGLGIPAMVVAYLFIAFALKRKRQ